MPARFALTVFVVLGSAPLAAQGGVETLGRGSFNGLKARVLALRFFESAGNIPAPKDRVVSKSFDALTTRFINLELELEYAKAAKQTPFVVECRYEGPAGASRTLSLSGTVEAGWTGSYHAGGVGSPERGAWAPGVYKVSCREAGQVIAATQIEVVQSVAAVRKLGAAVVQMKFYQSLAERQPVETRRYSTRFDTQSARWIKTEFALVYPQVTAPVSFIVECAYVFPDKSVKRVSVERQIPPGWTGSVHVQGIGRDSSARWPVGKYSVSCWNNTEKMAERTFEVFDGGVPPPATTGARLRFSGASSGKAAGNDAGAPAPVYASSFELMALDSLYAEASVPARAAGDSTSFGCVLTDPAGVTSSFALKGELRDRDRTLVASGPVGAAQEGPRLRGTYRVECRTGPRAVVVERFELTGAPELPALDARLLNLLLFDGGDEPPGDEAVADVVFSAAKLRSLWVTALFDHPSDRGAGSLEYSCRITGARNVTLATSAPQTVTIGAGDRTIQLASRLTLASRQRWTAGKYSVSCAAGTTTLLKVGLEVTR